jgi:hypothetical protein
LSTNNHQTPWFSESYSTQIYFDPGDSILKQEREQWIAALEEGTYTAVDRFLNFFSVSAFAAAARAWIADFRQAGSPSLTRVSPAAAELAWTSTSTANFVPRLEGALALSSTLSRATQATAVASPLARTLPSPSVPTTEHDVAEFITSHGKTVVAADVAAKEHPNESAPTAKVFTTGTTLLADNFQTDSSSNLWLAVREPGDAKEFFVSVPDYASLRMVDIGRPALELSVPGPRTGLITAVEAQPIINAIDSLRKEGQSITRVSIATPDTSSKRDQDIVGGRATYIAHILREAKIPGDRITILEAADFPGRLMHERPARLNVVYKTRTRG